MNWAFEGFILFLIFKIHGVGRPRGVVCGESRQLWGYVVEGKTFSLHPSKCEETFILYQELKDGTDSFLP